MLALLDYLGVNLLALSLSHPPLLSSCCKCSTYHMQLQKMYLYF